MRSIGRRRAVVDNVISAKGFTAVVAEELRRFPTLCTRSVEKIIDLYPPLIAPCVHEVDTRERRLGWGEVENARRLSDRNDSSSDPQFVRQLGVSTKGVNVDLQGRSTSEGVIPVPVEGCTPNEELDWDRTSPIRFPRLQAQVEEKGDLDLKKTWTANDADLCHTAPPWERTVPWLE